MPDARLTKQEDVVFARITKDIFRKAKTDFTTALNFINSTKSTQSLDDII